VLSEAACGWTSIALTCAIKVAISCVMRTAARAGTVRLRPITKASDVLRVHRVSDESRGIAGDSTKKVVENGNGTKVVHRFAPIGTKEKDERYYVSEELGAERAETLLREWTANPSLVSMGWRWRDARRATGSARRSGRDWVEMRLRCLPRCIGARAAA